MHSCSTVYLSQLIALMALLQHGSEYEGGGLGRHAVINRTLIAGKPWITALQHCNGYGDCERIGDDNEGTTFRSNEALTSRVRKGPIQTRPDESGNPKADWFNCTGEQKQSDSATEPNQSSTSETRKDTGKREARRSES